MSAHVEVWRSTTAGWSWQCRELLHCPCATADFGRAPTHAEALQAALDHCARYPIKDRP